MAYYAHLFDPWTTHEDALQRAHPSATTVAAEVTFRGTTSAGREVEFDAVDVFDLHNGRIVSLSSWYDLVDVRRQLAGGPSGGALVNDTELVGAVDDRRGAG
jgi:ketosteroid isomerase-like protein